MKPNRIAATLVFFTLLSACGLKADPTPPSPTPEPVAVKPNVSEPLSTPWYERYSLNEVVVSVTPGAVAETSSATAERVRRSVNPTPASYRQRLATLQQERARLLRDNQRLQASARERQNSDQTQLRESLVSLRSQLDQLRARQNQVNTNALAMTEEHGTILELLAARAPNIVGMDLERAAEVPARVTGGRAH